MGRSYRYKEIQLAQLRGFCAVAAHRSFTAAAGVLEIAPSTVWEQVRALEKRFNTVLVQQRGRDLEITPQGQLLYELVQPHVEGLDSLARLFELGQSQLPQNVTVASTQYLFRYHLSNPIQEFASKNPGVHVNVRMPDVHVMQQAVERGEVDFGVEPLDSVEPRNPALDYEELFHLEMVFMTRTDHPMARKKRVKLQDIVPYPLILPSKETIMRRLIDRVLESHGIKNLIVAMDIPLFDTILKSVTLGAGMAIVYIGLKNDGSLPGLRLHAFDPAPEPLPVFMITRRHVHVPPLVTEIKETIRHALAGPRRAADKLLS